MTNNKNQGRGKGPGEKSEPSSGADLTTSSGERGAPTPQNVDPPKAMDVTTNPAGRTSAPEGGLPPCPRRSRAKQNRRVIHVYASSEQYAEITARSAQRNLAISEYMRMRALRGAIPSAYLIQSVMDQKTHESLNNSLRILDDTGRRLRDHDESMTDEDVQLMLDELRRATIAIHD